MGCEVKCKAAAKCTAFTWHDKTTGSFATDCYLMEHGDKWSQGTPLPGHHTALCTPAGSTEEISQDEEPVLQSYGGVMRSPNVWPVPGQGNDDYPPGSQRPADGATRGETLLRKRAGVPDIPAAASEVYVDYGSGTLPSTIDLPLAHFVSCLLLFPLHGTSVSYLHCPLA